jgi:polyribonucleotide nucleotidyltransferase
LLSLLIIFVIEPEADVISDSEGNEVNRSEITKELKEFLSDKWDKYLFNIPRGSKGERKAILSELKEQAKEYLKEKYSEEIIKILFTQFDALAEEQVTRAILDNDKRVDGRKLKDIRELSSEVGLLPRTHGSGLFSRGETQILSVATLGAPGDEQILDGMEEIGRKRYMHHYNFPPYSVGEVSPLRGAGRREIGHGALAEKALMPVLPPKEDFPYTIRVVSEVLGSNGSSSMGSTCGSTLALMDAGVPITRPVAGIAIGIASDGTGAYKVITDIQDLEDGEGGMDFKVTGTTEGITAIQMDTKTLGLSLDIIKEALAQAKDARLEILKSMAKKIKEPRKDLSPYAPRIISFKINPEKIKDVIGPGGKMINEIIDATGVTIDIEDDGSVFITGVDQANSEKAKSWIEDITKDAEVGQIYEGKVVKIADFGAFVEILPKKDGLLHISEISEGHVRKVEDVLKLGQVVRVKVIKIDDTGRINLSMKRLK